MGIHREEGGLAFTRIERKAPVLRPALQSKQSSLYGLHSSGDRGGGGPNGQIVSVKSAADGRRQRSQKIINEEREKYRAKNGSLRNTSTDSKGTTFMILIDHRSVPIRKKRIFNFFAPAIINDDLEFSVFSSNFFPPKLLNHFTENGFVKFLKKFNN